MNTQTLDLIGDVARLMWEGRTLEQAAAEIGVRPLAEGRRRIEARLAEMKGRLAVA